MAATAAPRSIFLFQRSITTSSGARTAFHIMSKRSLVSSTAVNAVLDAGTSNDDPATQYFLLKSEPVDYSISDLERDCTEEWDGIRNYQARNFLRTMKTGDRAFFYHSKAAKPALTGIVGTCKIVREAQPDKTALDPKSVYYDAKCTENNCKWDSVLVEYEQTFPAVLSLKEMKEVAVKEPNGMIAGLALLKQSRLSVVPVEKEQWDEVIRLISDKASNQDESAKNKEVKVGGKRQK